MIVVHIGLPKSGSATIQTFLDTNEAALRGLSIDYPPLGRQGRKAHHNFAHELKGRAERFDHRSGRVADLVTHLAKTPHRTTILSAESFAACDGEAVARFHDQLSRAGQPLRVIMVIRDLVDLAPSSYAQKVRHGVNTYDFDAFFEERTAKDKFNVFGVAENWAAAFGWDALRIRVLDPAQLVNGDLIDDFLTVAGVDPMAPEVRALPRQVRVNESAGWMTLEALRALFKGESGLPASHPLVIRLASGLRGFEKKRIGRAGEEVGAAMGWNADRGGYLTRGQARWMLDAYDASLSGLNRHLAKGLPAPLDLDAREFVERAFLPDATHIPADALAAFYDALAARAVVAKKNPAG
ncbi:MAG: hypothetical protein ABI056_07460 [Caulobacteraceae bacterium]